MDVDGVCGVQTIHEETLSLAGSLKTTTGDVTVRNGVG
jgi:hypothetical protein